MGHARGSGSCGAGDAGSARRFWHSPKPPNGAPATRLRVSSAGRTRSTTIFGGVTYDVAQQVWMGHGRCAKIWPQSRLTKAWSRRAEARGLGQALAAQIEGATPITMMTRRTFLDISPVVLFAIPAVEGNKRARRRVWGSCLRETSRPLRRQAWMSCDRACETSGGSRDAP
jgi:hypothetical protein